MWTATRGRFGLLCPLVCCFVALAHRVLVDGWQTLPLLGIWLLGTGARLYSDDRQIITDAIVFSALNAKEGLMNLVLKTWKELDVPMSVRPWDYTSGLAVLVLLFTLLSRYRAYCIGTAPKGLPDGVTPWTLPYPKARIFPSQIKHARMFPKRHSFEYSYLQCGFPVIPGGVLADGTEVGCGHDLRIGSWWLRIRAEDYLSRGNTALGFYGKLRLFLGEQHVDDTEWSYAYLVTAPRILGYAFNPVSFWYIYDSEHQLQKMIVEVNNTFGEKRMYLLDGSNVMPGTPPLTNLDRTGAELPLGAKSRFTDIWVKDFHISPFNSRKGSYVLKALNPFPYVTYTSPAIDNTITLISSQDYAKLVARLNSTGEALDPDRLSVFDSIRFMLDWWWVGLVVFPRIFKEGFTLFVKQKLRVWLRPEVLATCVGRAPTSTELELSKIFKDYLLLLVNQSEKPFHIRLHTATPDHPMQEIVSTHQSELDSQPLDLELRVLTPAFYSRFVHYAHSSEAFDRECIFTEDKNRTLWISRPQLLPLLLDKPDLLEIDGRVQVTRDTLDELRWTFMKKLRCAPYPPAYAVSTPSLAELMVQDVRSLPFSELDQCVRSLRGRARAGEYRRSVTKLFLAQRFGFGYGQVVGLLDLIARVLLSCLGVMQLTVWRVRIEQAGTGGCTTKMLRDGNLALCFSNVRETCGGEWQWLLVTMMSMSACNIYGLLKGYN